MELTLFCDTYIIAEYLRLKRILNSMPRYKVGNHKGFLVIREYSGHGNEKSRKTANENGRAFIEMQKGLSLFNEYSRLLKTFSCELKKRGLTIPDDFTFINEVSFHNGCFWKEVDPCSNPREVQTEYYDDYGNKVRSRGEMFIGNALKDLGLDAKYEPTLELKGGRKIHPDYAFPVYSIDRCFFIEFMGMCDNEEYLNHNYGRIDEYMRNDILPNRDLILICGTSKWIPSQESIKRIIASFINNSVERVYSQNN